MDIDLATVRAFVAAAEQRHFGHAAESLFLTQQALSKRIKRLEETLSVRLFDRTRHGAEPTEAGSRFLPHARELLAVADRAVAAAGSDDRPVRLDLIDNRLSPMFVLRTLADAEPGLRIEHTGRNGLAHALDPLVNGEVDIAFGRVNDLDRPIPPALRHYVIRREPLLAVLPPEHPLAGGAAVALADLAGEGVWLPSANRPGGPVEWQEYLRRMSRDLGVEIDDSGNSYDLRHTLEQARYGRPRVTLVGADMQLPRDLNLRTLPFRPSPLYPWSIVWHSGNTRPSVLSLLDLAVRTSAAQRWRAYHPQHDWLPECDRPEPVSRGAAGTTA